MRKIKTVILDDDKSCNELLQREAAKFARLDVIKSFTEPERFLDFMFEHPEIELALLDQQIGNYQGLDLIEQLSENLIVVMITGYEEFGSKAYKKDVAAYVIKPISYESLADAVRKVERRMNLTTFWPKQDFSDGYFTAVRCDKKGKEKFEYYEVVYIQSLKDVSLIHCLNERAERVVLRIGQLAEDLPPQIFMRIHNQQIVNTRYMKNFCDGHVKIYYEDNVKKMSVGTTYVKAVEAWFNDRLVRSKKGKKAMNAGISGLH